MANNTLNNKKVILVLGIVLILVLGGIYSTYQKPNPQNNIPKPDIVKSKNDPEVTSVFGTLNDDDAEECKAPQFPLTTKDTSEIMGRNLNVFAHKSVDSNGYKGYMCTYHVDERQGLGAIDIEFYYNADNDWKRVVWSKSLFKKIEGIGDEAYAMDPEANIYVKKGNQFIVIRNGFREDHSDVEKGKAILKKLAERALSRME